MIFFLNKTITLKKVWHFRIKSSVSVYIIHWKCTPLLFRTEITLFVNNVIIEEELIVLNKSQ